MTSYQLSLFPWRTPEVAKNLLATATIDNLRDFLGWTPIDTLLSEFASIAYHLDYYNAIDAKVLELYGEALTAAIAVEVKGALLQRMPDLPPAWFPTP